MGNVLPRDQFVLGKYDDNVRKRLLSESKLTFEKSVELSTVVQQVSSDVATIKGTNIHNETLHKMSYHGAKQYDGRFTNPAEPRAIINNYPCCTYRHQYGNYPAIDKFCQRSFPKQYLYCKSCR